MDKTEFTNHRKAFLEQAKEQSFALFFSGSAPYKTNDQRYKYVANRNFYYLTGIIRENMTLLLVKGKTRTEEYIFIEEPSDYATKWLGRRMTKQEASEASGVEVGHILFNADFSTFMDQQVLSDSRKSLIGMPKVCYLDLYRDKPLVKPASMESAGFIIDNYPEVKIKNANDSLDLLRMVKSEAEISEIEKAIEYTKSGIEALMQNAKPGINEHQLDALFDFTIRLKGSEGTAFTTITASGKNATVLHYEENNHEVSDKEMVLLDLGALSGVYAADISRTFPVNGKFTDRQKQLYDLVLSVNKQTMALVKPGIMVQELNRFAKEELAKGLVAIGLIKETDEVDRYYYHNVSHYLGLDVHDVGTYQLPLAAGRVLTIEPGLYIEEEGIGIRIEDNVLVTDTGYRNLSEGILKEVGDIEELMKFNL